MPNLARPGQPLRTHLETVGTTAANSLPEPLSAIARTTGRWHDLGKYDPPWQAYLTRPHRGDRLHHSKHGAALALSHPTIPQRTAWAIALAIEAHHGKLKNFKAADPSLALNLGDTNIEEAIAQSRAEGFDLDPGNLPTLPDGVAGEMLVRLIYAALIDADRTDAARAEGAAIGPDHGQPAIAQIPDLPNLTPKDTARARFAQLCQTAATNPHRRFRLTGPTGIGKTRAGVLFARDRIAAGLAKNLLYVAPYKSILTQTADRYREWFGPDAILEHHGDGEGGDRLTQERWNAPVICTTGVQFWESLLSNRGSKTRKLVGLRDRIIILDEAQSIPPRLAIPLLSALQTAAETLNCTVVLATATQPAFDNLPIAQDYVEIVPPAEVREFAAIAETATWEHRGALDWDAIYEDAADVAGPVAIIVNLTRLAAGAALALQGRDRPVIHLSARMCPAHQRAALAEIARSPNCLVVATQVIEAGVDLDFARVYSQFAPLDAMVQRAGRCDRHGNRPGSKFVIFDVEGAGFAPYDRGLLRATELAMQKFPGDRHAAMKFFSRKVYGAVAIEEGGKIERLRRAWQFEEVANAVQVIADEGDRVRAVVPWGESEKLVASLANVERLSSVHWRQLGQFMVALPRTIARWEGDRVVGAVRSLPNGILIYEGSYCPLVGVG